MACMSMPATPPLPRPAVCLGPIESWEPLAAAMRLCREVSKEPASYLSIGPVFPTITKQTSRAPIGVEGVRKLREEAGADPILVAVAGITLATAPQVLAAGASVVAVAGAIFRAPDPVGEFRRWANALN